MNCWKRTEFHTAIITVVVSMVVNSASAQSSNSPTNTISTVSGGLWQPPFPRNIWQDEVGHGFAAGAQSIGVSLGAGYGATIFGSRQHHDLALTSLTYGYMIGPVQGDGHWYQGNWELRGELFTGAQFSPATDWVVGIAPHLRYNFSTGTRWVPFFDAGAGVSATSIGAPDLSNYFEFNLQLSSGVRWFIRDDMALTAEARYVHLSCGGINSPNLGLNDGMGFLGICWFF